MRLNWQFVVLCVLAVAGGIVLIQQYQVAEELRVEIAVQRDENLELARLRAENQRRSAAQIAPAELETLRADHAAVVRLRTETEALQRRIDDMNRAAKAKLSAAGAPR